MMYKSCLSLVVNATLASVISLVSLSVHALAISPGSQIDNGPKTSIDPDVNTNDINDYIEDTYSVTELYKFDGGGSESGPFSGSYETTFNGDESGGSITFTGGTSISCPQCFLLVKDGNHTPYWYLFNINSWDGNQTITLSGFWPDPDKGAISHVGIWGASVPAPAVAALIGLGLIGFASASRLKKKV